MTDSPESLPSAAEEAEEAELIELAGRIFDAARGGDAEALGAFLAAGAPVNLANDRGDTLLMLAAYHGHAAAVRLLLDAAPTRTRPTTAARPRWPAPSSRGPTRRSTHCSRAVPTRTPGSPRPSPPRRCSASRSWWSGS